MPVDPHYLMEGIDFRERTITIPVLSTLLAGENNHRVQIGFFVSTLSALGNLASDRIWLTTNNVAVVNSGFLAFTGTPQIFSFQQWNRLTCSPWKGIATGPGIAVTVLELFYYPKKSAIQQKSQPLRVPIDIRLPPLPDLRQLLKGRP